MKNLKKELEQFFDNYIEKDGTYLADHINTDALAKKVSLIFAKKQPEIFKEAISWPVMKPMVYKKKRHQEVLFSGTYKGRKFVILSLGTRPTAYIELKDKETEKSKSYDDYDLSCHCGFTYLGEAYWDELDKSTYIGWDYAHCGDYSGYHTELKIWDNEKRWTTEEIFQQVMKCIDEFEIAEWVDVSKPHFVLKVLKGETDE